MAQYLVAIHHPDNYDPSREGQAMERYRCAQRREDRCRCQDLHWRPMPGKQREVAAGASPMGRCSSPTGRIWRPRSTPGGFWVMEAVDLDEALAWGA